MTNTIRAWDMTQEQQRVRLQAVRYCEEQRIEDDGEFERVFQAMLHRAFMEEVERHTDTITSIAMRYGVNPLPYLAAHHAYAAPVRVRDDDLDLEAA